MQALANIEVMNAYNVKHIVTTCPHSYNTIKNEYRSLGGNYTVQHHTEFISTLITEGKLTITGDLKGKHVFRFKYIIVIHAQSFHEFPCVYFKYIIIIIIIHAALLILAFETNSKYRHNIT